MTFLSKIHPEFIPFDRKYFLKKLQEKYEQKVSQLVFSFYLFTTQILKLIENLNSVTSMALFLYKKTKQYLCFGFDFDKQDVVLL